MVLWTLLACASGADAQAALAATSSVTQGLPPDARLTLRPGPGFEQLAAKVARVLTLRGSATVEIGDPPPPALLEAVAAGHVALAAGQTEGSAHLVLGAAMGASYEATIALSPDGEEDARVLALAIEALRDRAIATRERYEAAPTGTVQPVSAVGQAPQYQELLLETPGPGIEMPEVPEPSDAPVKVEVEAVSKASSLQPPQPGEAGVPGSPYQLIGDPRDDDGLLPRPDPSERTLKVQPRLYFSVYGGASSESRAFRTGVGTGGGLCVKGQCLLLGIEYPLPINMEQGGDDVRYRYPTFSCMFHSQPFEFGRFVPAVSVGVLSRVGHFERDMGVKDYLPGLDTDLGVRGTVEGAFEVLEAIDVVAQAGVDYALDRWQYGDVSRGSRTAPWLQAGIRVRPE